MNITTHGKESKKDKGVIIVYLHNKNVIMNWPRHSIHVSISTRHLILPLQCMFTAREVANKYIKKSNSCKTYQSLIYKLLYNILNFILYVNNNVLTFESFL